MGKTVLKYVGSVLLLIFLFSNVARSADTRIDSLKQIIELDYLTAEERVHVLIRLSVELVYVNPTESFNYADQGLRLARDINYERGIASAYRIIGSIYATQDNYISASDFIQRALRIFEANYDSAGIANCYISLGHTFRFQNNHAEELKYHRQAYEIYRSIGNTERLGVTAHNFGESLLNAGKVDSALSLTRYAIGLNESLNRRSILSSCYKALGRIYYEMSDISEAEKAFQNVIDISEELGPNSQKLALIESLIYLSHIYKKTGQQDLQYEVLMRALNLNKRFYFYGYTDQIYEELISYHIENNNLEQAQKLFYSSNEIMDSIETQQQLDRSELMMNAIKVYQLEEDTRLKGELIAQQGQLLYLTISFIILMGGAVFMVVRINKRLKETNRQLEDQKKIVEEQREELHALNATKDKFFGIVAHDLRGPVGGLKQLIELYYEMDETNSREEKKMLEQSILKSSATTYSLVVNLISWAKLQMQKETVHSQPVSVKALIERVFDIYEQEARKKKVALKAEIPETADAMVDYNHLDLVLRNLVNNALKFSNSGGEIVVTAEEMEDQVQIHVSDNGVGITEKVQESLFNLEEHSTIEGTRGEQGSGLGLILGREFIILNNGTLSFTSEKGIGTTFTISLPKA